jgi:epoxyqueuosine reductase QueG
MNAEEIRQACQAAGADLCGIAPVERFSGAPAGHHPTDLLPDCRSVIVLACRFPVPSPDTTPEEYTQNRNIITEYLDNITKKVSGQMTIGGMTVKTISPLEPGSWDPDGRFRAPLSLKHAGVFAGLGTMGKNTLLINDRFGNMIWLSAILTTASLEPDPLASYSVCLDFCSACIDACPVNAIGDGMKDQLTCFSHAYLVRDEKDTVLCWRCRVVCPHRQGLSSFLENH